MATGIHDYAKPAHVGPGDGVIRTAFVVEDIRSAMHDYTSTMNAGPWFLRDRFVPPAATYRGQATVVELSLAFGYSGTMMIELIEQHNDVPSVFNDVVSRRGYGLHHLGIATSRYDELLEHYMAAGYRLGFTAIRLARLAIIDTLADAPFMVELIEMRPAVQAFFSSMHAASVEWDGSDPVRILPR